MKWTGVMPAITTNFDANYKVDHGYVAEHCRWMIQSGCTAIVALGSLGEGSTLEYDEKLAILDTCVRAAGSSAPVVAAISSLRTSEAAQLAKEAARRGCQGLMILPPYVYRGDWREMKSHVAAVLRATELPGMLYNNPVAYGTDFLPEHIAELANEHPNLRAVKESSTDVRRVAAIRALLGDRLAILVGVDDCIVESIRMGAVGWIAGLANVLPVESVDLFEYASNDQMDKALALYNWFLPLLRMDTVPKFIQLIKLAQQEAGHGSARVRAPRLELDGPELKEAKRVIARALETRPQRQAEKTGARS
ncbi:MAG TPA: dihydrodipicolinate synthase family protein [Candidatus Acidoferrales bacterium]|nr:dihydrodipicolinate synthase family protein [Candidatus Acidoferrales bacterium]